ncbi:MAG: hypothetical protein LBS03_09315 [Bacteroidales bacterium]|jgi:hypothetical protein|nr:hypothetical protein [Bacteroidales bacterium]
MKNRIKKALTIFLPVVLLANMLVSPLLAVSNANALSMEEEAAAYIEAGADTTPLLGVSAGHVGIWGIDTLVNIIKGIKNFVDAIVELGNCISTWSKGAGFMMAFMLCPFILMSKGVTQALISLMNGMFTVRIFNNGDSFTVMRDVTGAFTTMANIIFIIILLIAIISMITSIGISNYHLKKLAPKIAITAIAINLSFYICVLLVDVSNIAGGAIANLIEGAGGEAQAKILCGSNYKLTGADYDQCMAVNGVFSRLPDAKQKELIESSINPSAAVEEGAKSLAVLANAQFIWLILAVIVVVLVLFEIYAVIMATIYTSIRLIFLIALTIVSPLAFVLWLHPKGQKYFFIWFKNFGGLLLIYPAFGAIVGISSIASMVIQNLPHDNLGSFIIQVVGMFVAIAAPILFVKPLMKKCSSLMAAAANAVQGAVSAAAMVGVGIATGGMSAGAMGALKGGAGAAFRQTDMGKSVMPQMDKYKQEKASRGIKSKGDIKRDMKLSTQERANKERTLANYEATGQGDSSQANALRTQMHNDDVATETIGLSSKGEGAIRDIVEGRVRPKNVAQQQAAFTLAREKGYVNKLGVGNMIQDVSTLKGPELAAAEAQNMAVSEGLATRFGGGFSNSMRASVLDGTATEASLSTGFVEKVSSMSPQAMAGDDKVVTELKNLANQTESSTILGATTMAQTSTAVKAEDALTRLGNEAAANANVRNNLSATNANTLQVAKAASTQRNATITADIKRQVSGTTSADALNAINAHKQSKR